MFQKPALFRTAEYSEEVTRMCSAKKVFLKLRQACEFVKKDTLAQVFSCEFWEILKNT